MAEILDFIELEAFSNGSADPQTQEKLVEQIKRAYGVGGLGILTVKNVPRFPELRKKLLVLAQKVADLPKSSREKLMDPDTNYLRGWSHGVETLDDGTLDLMKGSYYGNPNFNNPAKVLKETRNIDVKPGEYEFYSKANIWPENDVPELESAFLELGNLITDVGKTLAKVCDAFVLKYDKNLNKKDYKPLKNMLDETVCNMGRLLHYFPPQKLGISVDDESSEKWCGVHCDHSILTGLCKAIFLDEDFNEVKNTDPEAGLYIVLPDGNRKKIVIPDEHIGFQLGHCAQVVSNSFLRATPHLVRAPAPSKSTSSMKMISRNTFAVFLQPFWGEKLITRMKAHELVEGFSEKDFYSGMTFGHFSEKLVEHYHRGLPKAEESSNPTSKL